MDTSNTYHDKYLILYQQLIEKYTTTPFPYIKEFCYTEMQRIKHDWVNIHHLDITELTQFDPIDIAV